MALSKPSVLLLYWYFTYFLPLLIYFFDSHPPLNEWVNDRQWCHIVHWHDFCQCSHFNHNMDIWQSCTSEMEERSQTWLTDEFCVKTLCSLTWLLDFRTIQQALWENIIENQWKSSSFHMAQGREKNLLKFIFLLLWLLTFGAFKSF